MKTDKPRRTRRKRTRRFNRRGTRRLQFSQLSYEPLEDRCLLADTGMTGGGMAHENVQPSLAINYVVNTNGTYPGGFSSGTLGAIIPFAGHFAPNGTLFANGQLLPIAQNQALFSLFGTMYGGDGQTTFALPDLRGRTPIGIGQGPGLSNDIAVGERTGTETVTLTTAQMPSHTHVVSGQNTEPTGGGLAHSNLQPSLGVQYLVATQGIFPDSGSPWPGSDDDPIIGEVMIFGGNFVPQGWARADGSLLAIANNTALFSLVGTIYGGDGQTTFGLPDLQGRAPVQPGTGPGLNDAVSLGQKFGTESTLLTEANLPSHSHTALGGNTENTGGGTAHENWQPSLGLQYFVTTQGVFPVQGSGNGTLTTNTLGAISMYAGAGPDTSGLNGQLLPISQNSALFSILGTTYGGDGETTFGLPDLRGRVPVHSGGNSAGPNLTARALGARFGTETVTLTTAELPAHSHTLPNFDTTPPTVTSIVRQTPASSPTNANSVTFRVTFSEDVQNVDTADFDLSGTASGDGVVGAPNAVTGTSVYDVTITGLTSSNGTVNLDFAGGQNIQDLAGNALANTTPGSDEQYTLDNTAPVLNSFARLSPATSPTNADSLVFRATFNEDVTNVDAADFVATGTTATLSVNPVNATTYDITLMDGNLANLDATVGINLAGGHNITDVAGNALPVTQPNTDEEYVVDNTAPAVTAIDRVGASPTSATSVDFSVTFNEAVSDIETGDFALATTGGVTANIASVSATAGTTVTVTVDTIAGIGTLGLNFDFDATDSVLDAAGNAAAVDFTGQAYTIASASAGMIIDDAPPIFDPGGFTYFTSTTMPQGYAGADGIMDVYFSAKNSGNMATWTIPVTPGIYRVATTWFPHENRATNSPFSVFDGPATGTPVQATTVNQELAPDDFEDDGVFWEQIFDEIVITGTTLAVKLSDTPANDYVIADAMRIERIVDPNIEVTDLDYNAPVASGDTIDLRRVLQGTSETREFRIANRGSDDLAISGVSISNTQGAAFSLSPDPDPVGGTGSIGFGAGADFTVALDTSTAGTYSATVTIASNDPDTGTFTFDVTAMVGPVRIIDNSDPDFSAPKFLGFGPGYTTNPPQGYQGNVHWHDSATAGAGLATWTFDVTPGTYQIAVTWSEHMNRANNSPFTLAGTTTNGTVPINQRLAPSTFAGAFMDDGVSWAPLVLGGNGGNFTVNGATLTVTLGTSPFGAVIADAVRIEKMSPLLADSVAADSGDGRAAAALSPAAVDAALHAAIAHWSATDASAAARLSNVTVNIANLPGEVLGLASQSTGRIWIDSNAAGSGWHVVNPHSAFPNPTSIDLLSVVTHELGHVLGLPDLDADLHPHDVMAGRLDAGIRRLPFGIQIASDSASTLPPALWPADRLFAGLGGMIDGERRDELSDIGQVRRDESAAVIHRELETGGSALEIDRLLDDEEDLFADLSEHRADHRDEESADQLFAELFDERG